MAGANKMKTVCAIMLANGREAMVRRAVKSFQSQTYPAKELLIWDTGELNEDHDTTGDGSGQVMHIPAPAYRTPNPTIGALRNEALHFFDDDDAGKAPDIIIHWDSDDWSHPNRIAEQVALLESSGKQVVGYKDLLFWDSTPGQFCGAWLWKNDLAFCGTSLCYYREAWERVKFTDAPRNGQATSEYEHWKQAHPFLVVSSLVCDINDLTRTTTIKPRMIGAIHGANTMSYERNERNGMTWKRVPDWDKHCREVMAL